MPEIFFLMDQHGNEMTKTANYKFNFHRSHFLRQNINMACWPC